MTATNSSNEPKFCSILVVFAVSVAFGFGSNAATESGINGLVTCRQALAHQLKTVTLKRDALAITNSDGEVIKASYSREVALGTNMEALLNLIGTGNYKTKPLDLFFRELIQNSVDAVRREKYVLDSKNAGLGGVARGLMKMFSGQSPKASRPGPQFKGQVNIFTDILQRRLVIEDNGTGMNLDTIERAFLTIGGTDKGPEASGGFGIAKGALLAGSKTIFVSTIHNGLQHDFTLDSKKLFKDPKAKIKIHTTKSPNQPNGTIIAVEFPEGSDPIPYSETKIELYNKPFLVEQVDVVYSGSVSLINKLEDIRSTLEFLKKSDLVKLKPFFKAPPTGPLSIVKEYLHFESWGSVEIQVTKKNLNRGGNHQILSNGLYQFEQPIKNDQFKTLPYDIIINIKPTVKAHDPSYPFDLNRNGIRPSVSKDFDLVLNRVRTIIDKLESDAIMNLVNNLITLPDYNLEGRYERLMGALDKGRSRTFDDPEEGDTDANSIREIVLIQGDTPNIPGLVIQPVLNNRTTLDLSDLPDAELLFAKLTAVSEHIKNRYVEMASRSDEVELKLLAQRLKFFQMGIILNKNLHGINLSGRYNGIFFNPLTLKKHAQAWNIISNIVATIVHEITHVLVHEHSESFTLTEATLANFLESDGYENVVKSMVDEILLEHESTFKELRRRYQSNSVTNIDVI
jgi:hypothetical protein